MALTKVINDLADLNQSGSTNALKGCKGTTAQQPASSSSIDYLIVGGGGTASGSGSGGGGAGGLLTGTTTVYHGTPTVITVGEGAIGNTTLTNQQSNGNDSGFNGIRAIGGGSGQRRAIGSDGGAGGGGGNTNPATAYSGGSGTSGQGLGGGDGTTAAIYVTGGGGGAGGVGATGSAGQAGNGGDGTDVTSFISVANANLAQIGDTSNTTQVFVAGGGGGGGVGSGVSPTALGGTGGAGGGGAGSGTSGVVGTNGTSNTGGGGGGGVAATSDTVGGNGGSGVGIIKYDNTIVTGYTLNSEDTYTVNWPADKYGMAYWPLNLDAKNVGGNYDGTATDITYTNGQFNQAAVFNWTTSKIQITSPLGTAAGNENDNFSVSMWVKWDSVSSAASGLHGTLVGDYTGSNYGSFHIYVYGLGSGNGLALSVERYFNSTGYYNSSYLTVGTLSTLEADTWYNITHTYVGSSKEVKLYLDGTLIATYTLDSSAGGRTTNVYNVFGDYNNSGGYGHAGSIEQIRFYGSELSLTDVQDIYNNSKPGSLPPLKTSSDLTTTICNFPSGATGTALYQFEGTANDSCTVGPYNGTFTSPAYGTGKFGPECASFNGSSSYIDTNYTLPAISTISFSLWFKTSTTGSQMYMFGDFDSFGANASGRFALSIESTNYFGIRTGNGSIWFTDNTTALATPYQNGMWHHAVLTANGTALKLYIDGSLLASITSNPAVGTAGAQSMIFGRLGHYSTSYFNGDMDQVRIFQIELSSQQVYDLWQKENDTQTYFPNSSTDTDTLVFKSGSGEITFKNDTPPGAEVGMLRYNSTLGQMEHFNSGGWKDFTNNTPSTLATLDYPAGKGAMALYQLQTNTNDISTNYNATNVGSNIIFGGAGKWNATGSAYFNGSSSVATMANSSTAFNLQEFTYSIWINPSSLQSGCLFGNYNGSHQGNIISLQSSGVIEYYWTCVSCPGGSPTNNLQSNGTISLNMWTHVCCTFSSTTGDKRIYINGVLDNSVNLGAGYTMQFGSVTNTSFGQLRSHDTVTYYYHGLFQQIRIYNTALSATDVNLLYNES